MNYKMIISYDGTAYNGWQKQGNTRNTIQGIFENIISRMLGCETEVHGSGRTDAGTHAEGQVANFHGNTDMSEDEMKQYINKYLPNDIAVLELSKAGDRFHSRLNARRKTYVYRIWNSEVSDVFNQRYMFKYEKPLDIEKMKQAAQYLCGEHDFTSFCSNKRYKKSKIRNVYSIDVEKIGNEIRLTFDGDGFLYNMVRIMAGTIAECGEGKRKCEEIPQIIESKNREDAGVTLPACGLILKKVEY
ncbi:MAG: tRNA pseudouridine(38-40) synthase TruA [Firmicutes bacterium]|nr:tRNA pseudouridine(38-40) synthase TruA [Bacillota bacterium]